MDVFAGVYLSMKCMWRRLLLKKGGWQSMRLFHSPKNAGQKSKIGCPTNLKFRVASFYILLQGRASMPKGCVISGWALIRYRLFFKKKLGLGSPKPTIIILQLVDRYVDRPDGVMEDVLVQVWFFIFPVDIVVLNFYHDCKVPFILGRPFIVTGRAMIDVQGPFGFLFREIDWCR